MQIDAQLFLDLCEESNTICFLDIEATGLRGDYNSVLVVSILPYKGKPMSYHVQKPGRDKDVLDKAKRMLEEYNCWVTYYGKGFDIKMLNTRLLEHDKPPIDKRPHVDMYYSLKSNILTARRSQGHLLSWLELTEQKMGVSAEVWNRILADPMKEMPLMIKRCESDVRGLKALYVRTRHLIRDVTR